MWLFINRQKEGGDDEDDNDNKKGSKNSSSSTKRKRAAAIHNQSERVRACLDMNLFFFSSKYCVRFWRWLKNWWSLYIFFYRFLKIKYIFENSSKFLISSIRVKYYFFKKNHSIHVQTPVKNLSFVVFVQKKKIECDIMN